MGLLLVFGVYNAVLVFLDKGVEVFPDVGCDGAGADLVLEELVPEIEEVAGGHVGHGFALVLAKWHGVGVLERLSWHGDGSLLVFSGCLVAEVFKLGLGCLEVMDGDGYFVVGLGGILVYGLNGSDHGKFCLEDPLILGG